MFIFFKELYHLYSAYFLFFVYILSVIYCKRKANIVWNTIYTGITYPVIAILGYTLSLLLSQLGLFQDGFECLEFVVKAMGIFAAGIMIELLANQMLQIWEKKLFVCIKKYKYAIGIATFFLLQLIMNVPYSVNNWVSCWYVTDYSMGFGSRFLVGQLMKLIFGNFISSREAWIFTVIALIILIIIVSLIFNALLIKAEKSYTKGLFFLIICFMVSPCSIAAYWTEENMGRLEIYTLILTLLSVVVYLKSANKLIKFLSLSITPIICNAIYQGYMFLFFSMVLIVLLDKLISEYSKGKCWTLLFTTLSASLSFMVFQFASSVNFSSVDKLSAEISSQTDLEIWNGAIYYEFFTSISDAYMELVIPFLTGDECPRINLLLVFVFLLPLIVILFSVYRMAISLQPKVRKSSALWCLIVSSAVLPQFILNIDWGRWIVSVFIVLFFGLFYLIYVDNREMIITMQRLDQFIQKHWCLGMLTIIYLSLFTKMTGRGFLKESSWLITVLNTLSESVH